MEDDGNASPLPLALQPAHAAVEVRPFGRPSHSRIEVRARTNGPEVDDCQLEIRPQRLTHRCEPPRARRAQDKQPAIAPSNGSLNLPNDGFLWQQRRLGCVLYPGIMLIEERTHAVC